jgi:hypothetical protein
MLAGHGFIFHVLVLEENLHWLCFNSQHLILKLYHMKWGCLTLLEICNLCLLYLDFALKFCDNVTLLYNLIPTLLYFIK